MKSPRFIKKAGVALFALIVFLVPAVYGWQETVPMNGFWRFKPGDDVHFAQPSFDDTAWVTIRADKIWEEQGYETLDGFAWFRLKVVLPASLKETATLNDGLRICLGKITISINPS